MTYLACCFIIGLVTTLLVMRASLRHTSLSIDYDLTGPQKFHARAVPRVGGISVLIAIVGGVAFAKFNGSPASDAMWLLVLSSLPAFIAGLAEDLTKSVSPRRRLLATAVSASVAICALDAVIIRTSIPGVDTLLHWMPFSLVLTVFVVSGVANAVNIIDGFNGLASMCVLMMVQALGYVAFQVGDTFIFISALIITGAILGFFVWNFPAGLIFLGDGGAYLLGFLLAELSVLLIHRNPTVSPMFVLLLCAYPIFETIFTMYRRKVVRGVATAAPDGIHLHTLIHRRLIRWTLAGKCNDRRLTRRNSMTSPYLWMLCLFSVIPSVLWWNSTPVLAFFLGIFVLFYIWIYARIVRFKTPRWLIFRRTA